MYIFTCMCKGERARFYTVHKELQSLLLELLQFGTQMLDTDKEQFI